MNDPHLPDKTKHYLTGKTDVLSLDYNVAAALCYVPIPPINLLACIIWMLTEAKENKFLRFHAIQGLGLLGILIAGNVLVWIIGMLAFIPVIGGLFALLGGIAWFLIAAVWFGLSILLALKAKERELFKLPVIGDLADQYSN